MNTQKYLVAGVVVAVLLSGYNFVSSPKDGANGQNGQNGLGAVPTLDGVDSPYMTIGGVRGGWFSSPIIATSSTICSIKNPFTSTTTVTRAGLNITQGILGSNNVSLSTSTNSYATSTQGLVIDAAIQSLSPASVFWTYGVGTTTSSRLLANASATGQSQVLLGPGEYLNWRIATSTGAGALPAYYVGNCTAEIFDN